MDASGEVHGCDGGAGEGGGPVGRWRRRRLTGRVAVAITVLIVGLVIVEAFAAGWVLRSHHSSGPLAGVAQVAGPSQIDSRYPGATVLPQPYAKPAVSLVDTAGESYNLPAATSGRVALVYFGYTHCPDVCPINMALTAAALNQMPADLRAEVTVVFVTTDPTRDTPAVLRTWLSNFASGFVGLTGSLAQIHEAEQQVGMPLSTAYAVEAAGTGGYEVSHAGYTLVYSQDNVAHLSVDDTETAVNYARTLESLVEHGFRS